MASGHRGNRQKRRGGDGGGHNVKLSKLLSYTLRHGATKEGLNITPAGYVKVSDILNHDKVKGFKKEDIEQVVKENDKQRFSFGDENGELTIRANQGHSLEVPELELLELEPGELPVAIHGTYEKCIEGIKRTGLSKMRRQHIHMAVDEPGESGVISGMRKSCDYIITVNISRAQRDGLVFYRSSNNVILCEGNEEGCILPKYFDSVKKRK